MSFFTIGTYGGPSPEDPNAEFRKLFTVWENQQDGFASILKYCQTKAGFTVGSTETKTFQKILNDEFSDIVVYQPTSFATSQTELNNEELDEMLKVNKLPDDIVKHLPQDRAWQDKFVASLQGSSLVKSIIQFINRMDSRDLTLDIDEEHWVRNDFITVVARDHNAWRVNRGRMAERADWLVDHLGLKDNMEDWCKNITGDR